MRTVSARQANQNFSELLAAAEGGEELVITRHGRPVAILAPFKPTALTAERAAAIAHAEAMMAKGLPWGRAGGPFKRDEMHER